MSDHITPEIPQTIARTKVKLSWVEQVDRSLHSHAIRLVLFALVANTIMAQAFSTPPAASSSSAAST
jgi:hypothetical protein